ncbi:MAG TPA: TrkA family potassium uptake protein [Kofleriaceae bacterium]|jgi:trk system potassium uptake protein TrkA|nr:TrkA family potassium uptake protein [Kofleriaceae bacterium]
MSRYVVIGLGNFGTVISRRLYELGHEVIALDTNPGVVDAHGPYTTRAIVGDATKREVLEEAGAEGADAAIISIGENLGASILALLAIRDLRAKATYVKVLSEDHARICEALGVTDTVFPEQQAATNLASRITSSKLLHYTAYGEQFGIQEMAVPTSWAGKTLKELELPQQYQVQIVAIHDLLLDTIAVPQPGRKLTPSDTLLVAGAPAQLETLTKLG